MDARKTIEALRNCIRGKCEECGVIGQDFCQDRLMEEAADCIEELTGKYKLALSDLSKEAKRRIDGGRMPLPEMPKGERNDF